MRRALLIDPQGIVRVAPTRRFAAGLVYLAMAECGAEVAFHAGSVSLLALTRALRLLVSCRPKRIALRLLPEDGAPVRIFSGVWEFARHAESLALPASSAAAPEDAPAKGTAVALVSRLSFL